VLKNFADQSESVSTAQARLSGLRQEISVEPNVLTLIPDTAALRIMPTSLSPDGSKMAALDMSNGLNIAIVDCVTNKIERLTSYGWNDGMIYYGIWSPDGNEIAFIRTGLKETDPAELMAITLDGKSRVIFGPAESGIIPCDWTPDGKYILGVMGDPKPSFTLGLIPAGGGTFKELFSFGAHFDIYFARPAVSPDGQYILFEAGEKGVRNVHILKLENKRVSVIADHPADDYQPLWSPDGRHVVFLSRRHGNLDLWGITIKNGEALEDPFLVKEDVQEMNLLNWRRSGLACVNTFMLNDIFVVPVDQGSLKATGSACQIAYIPTGNNRVPVWSPDGKHLAFCSSDPADSSIYLVLLSEDPGEFDRYSVPAYKFGQLSYFPDLRWKPDGSGLSFTGEPEKGGLAFFQFKIDGEEWLEDPLSGLV
jgi:Tol biopolymer transport system component